MHRFLEWTIAATVVICASGPVFIRPRTRPNYLCGVPVANYKVHAFSQKIRAFSKESIDKLTTQLDVNAKETVEGKLFQWNTGKLAVNHCDISEFAVYVKRSGDWTVSLRGKQNYLMKRVEGSQATFVPGKGRYNDYLVRNLFYVNIRLYGAFKTEPEQSDKTNGKPAFIELRLQPFWVERATARFVMQQGWHSEISQYFHRLTRAEIEFYYR